MKKKGGKRDRELYRIEGGDWIHTAEPTLGMSHKSVYNMDYRVRGRLSEFLARKKGVNYLHEALAGTKKKKLLRRAAKGMTF